MTSIYDYSDGNLSTPANIIARSLTIFVTCLLGLASANYCIGQLISYDTVDFFCGLKTAEEVHAHNQKYNLTEGSTDDCWRILQQNLDETTLFDTKPTFVINYDNGAQSILVCIGFGIISISFFILANCSNHSPKTRAEKIKYYESRARHYQTLSDLQRLSPPYTSFNSKQMNARLNNDHMCMAYMNEALRYRKLAQNVRKETTSDSNGSE